MALAALLVRRLRAQFPEAEIEFLTRAANIPVVEAMPGLSGSIGWPGLRSGDRGALKELAASKLDLIIDLQNNLRTRRFAMTQHPVRLLRYHRPRWNRLARIHLPKMRSRLSTPLPVAVQYLNVAHELGVSDDGGSATLSPTQESVVSAQNRLSGISHDLGWGRGKLMVAAPGGRHGTKIWPAEKWIELLNSAYKEGYEHQILVGSKEDAAISSMITDGLHHPVANLCGKTDLCEVIGLITSADVVVSGDSGPMHLAAGLGKPIVAMFGPTVPEFGFTPFRARSRVVQVDGLACRPCHPHGPEVCPLGYFRCMKEISPEMVLAGVREVMELSDHQAVH